MTERDPAPTDREVVDELSRLWDEEPSRFYEPWVPEVGDLVQMHRSAECAQDRDWMHAAHLEDGAIGRVKTTMMAVFGTRTGDGHDYLVGFMSYRDGREDISWFAAAELILLDPARQLRAAPAIAGRDE